MTDLSAFKSYDIRGTVGVNLSEALFRDVGRAVVAELGAARVVTGRDARESSPALQAALHAGLTAGGAEVLDIGLCGTEEVYFATDHLAADAGLMVTASHNPMGDNGCKLVVEGARPLPPERLRAIAGRVAARDFGTDPAQTGSVTASDPRADYVARVLSFVDPAALPPLHLLVNAGNGAAGPTFDAIARALAEAGAPLTITRHHHAPDPAFPNGIPNPLLPENHAATAAPLLAAGADIGIAWDGDFDRCFLFDETGAFVPGEYVVGLLAEAFLADGPAKIVHDPRVQWNTQDICARHGGTAVVSRTGHALVKATMRESDAVYGGEMSAHHYFRRFMYCDSGMIPWLLVLALMGRRDAPLSALVAGMARAFPSSGEINFRLDDPQAAMDRVEAAFGPGAEISRLDGLSLAHADWRLNLRRSNTEPLLRLNMETRGDADLLARRLAEVRALIEGA